MHAGVMRPRVTALLGPTNTGKTHAAVERMLGHESGMIGFPLRLLARENFDRIVAAKGARQVALVTGEERIVPPKARYFVCTAESMPLDRPTAFLAVDEIQMAADPERGHIFTDRLLHARGLEETMFLGAETIRPLVRRLVPEASFDIRPRFSSLGHIGHRKVTRLPPRSAVVAFSAGEVYRLAELVRRQRGGAAVVLGALSPRARNAQVGMYQAGEVDYLVATDAIGMGLNMDVQHVAFSALRKFDGHAMRTLGAAEIGQIAGRAGRHVRDGTFGTTAELAGMAEEIVSRVEEHRFKPLETIRWRNSELDMSGIAELLHTLELPPPGPGLVRAREGEDHQALRALSKEPDIVAAARGRERVALLWEVCRIPDFRKTLSDAHTHFLTRVFLHLVEGNGVLPTDWVAGQVGRLNRTDGDIDTLMSRMAGVRTWTYVAHRAAWLDDPEEWRERTRALEDLLSDTLHERLTQRFVDRRAAALVRRLRGGGSPSGEVADQGDVSVEGEQVGRLVGFRYTPSGLGRGSGSRPLTAAAQHVLRTEIVRRIDAALAAEDAAFSLAGNGLLLWRDEPVARLAAGSAALAPTVRALASDLLDAGHSRALEARLRTWFGAHLRRSVAPLLALGGGDDLHGCARGMAYRLAESLGTVPRAAVNDLMAGLDRRGRQALKRRNVRIGRMSVSLRGIDGGEAARTLELLWRIRNGAAAAPPLRLGPALLRRSPDVAPEHYLAVGYVPTGPFAVRAAALERFADAAAALAAQGPFLPTSALARRAGCGLGDLPTLLAAVGYGPVEGDAGLHAAEPRRARRGARRAAALPDSPFAVLAKGAP